MDSRASDHPYSKLPPRAYWRSAVAELSPLMFENIYLPRFQIGKDVTIAAAGSCFAQHISNQFKRRGYNFLDMEPAPALLPEDAWHKFGFDLYSARFGNVYSIRQLLQLFQRAAGKFKPAETLWKHNGRYFDPFRPSIEPDGFATAAEAERDIEYHLSRVNFLLERTGVLVFTFGLTEAWVGTEDGAVYPTCPGTIAGTFDPKRHKFHNFTYGEVLSDANAIIKLARRKNQEIKFLFTVSPVPLTATASNMHVLPASVYSKSVLRAVCGELYATHGEVDYFPSYEMVASHPFRAMFFDPNLRTVASRGVDHVMNAFFAAHEQVAAATKGRLSARRVRKLEKLGSSEDGGKGRRNKRNKDDVVCDEEILEVFA